MSFELVCDIKRETDNAILIYDYATDENIWIPLSQVEEIPRSEPAKVVISDWIAQKKELL